ncbi:Cacna2d3 [Phodopus roborovskii]|uniref:Cacna2d3 protein n=1 Tax=Phodopus roborovskii TaxID=109678 RepID=A0AAV0A7Y5_PHORO|nr:Cacna2d3 [Phodopus roborovskii]
MNKLLTMGSFKRINLYDYQAMCRANKESSGSAHGLLDPYNAFLSAAKWIMTELVLFLVEFNLCSWWHSDMTAKAQKLKQILEPCDTEYPAFVSERTIKETTGNIACEDCSKTLASSACMCHTTQYACSLSLENFNSSKRELFSIKKLSSSSAGFYKHTSCFIVVFLALFVKHGFSKDHKMASQLSGGGTSSLFPWLFIPESLLY